MAKNRSSRPHGDPMAVRFKLSLVDEIERVAFSHEISRADVIRMAMDAGLLFIDSLRRKEVRQMLIEASGAPPETTTPIPIRFSANSEPLATALAKRYVAERAEIIRLAIILGLTGLSNLKREVIISAIISEIEW